MVQTQPAWPEPEVRGRQPTPRHHRLMPTGPSHPAQAATLFPRAVVREQRGGQGLRHCGVRG